MSKRIFYGINVGGKETMRKYLGAIIILTVFSPLFAVPAWQINSTLESSDRHQTRIDDLRSTYHQSYQTLEAPEIEWNKTYGGAGDDYARSVVQTGDGGYAICGFTRSSPYGYYDFWLVKTDAAGNMQWNKTFGGIGHDLAKCVLETGDGGYAICGFTGSFGAGYYDFWLVKTDAAGNMQWNKTYGGTYEDEAYSMVQTGDGGYAICGLTRSFGARDHYFWLVKTDSAGNMQWNRTYGGPYSQWAECVVETGDGGYAICGRRGRIGPSGYGVYDFWLVKTDAAGNMQWNKTYGGTNHDYALSVVQTGDGGYAICGPTSSFGAGMSDFWLVKTDAAGNMQWNKTFGGIGHDLAKCVLETGDGGYAICGSTVSFGANSELWLVKTDAAGNMQWNKTYGGPNHDHAECVVETGDGGYALAGFTGSFGAGYYDFWLVKVGSNPRIISIHPPQPVASAGKQLVAILGEGFVPDSELTFSIGADLYPIPGDRISFKSSDRIEVVVGLTAGLWRVWVTNPGGIQSDEYYFQIRSFSEEDIRKVLGLALQYWSVEDAVRMTAIAGGESGWNPNVAYDEEGYHPFNYMGYDSWGLWQIFMDVHKEMLGDLGAPTDDPGKTAKWLLDPNNNCRTAYEVWKIQRFKAWSAYTQAVTQDGTPNPSYYKNFLDRVIKIAKRMSIFKCPVNVTIRDNYGRIISEIENQIPGANFEYFNATETKIFYLPLNLTYHVQINATAYGNITMDQITSTESIFEIAFSQATFNLTSETVAEFNLIPYDANYTLKVDENGDGLIDYELAPEVRTLTTEYDIGIIEIVPSKTIVGEGYNLPTNITVMNYGAYSETFNVTLYVNETFVELQTVTLASGDFMTAAFTGNTTGVAKGNYTLSAVADILPGETDTVDNSFTDGWIIVAMIGDITGPTPGIPDGKVDIRDIALVASKFGAVYPDSRYDANCDLTGPIVGVADGKIDIRDIAIVAIHYGEISS